MKTGHSKIALTLRQKPEAYYGKPTGKTRWLAGTQDKHHPTGSVLGRGYPPPPPTPPPLSSPSAPSVSGSRTGGAERLRAAARNVADYFRTCFSHRIYLLISLAFAFASIGTSVSTFHVFHAASVGLTLAQYGKIIAVSGIVAALLGYPLGSLVDRFHPVRMMFVARLGLCVVTAPWLVFLFADFAPATALRIYVCISFASVLMMTVFGAAGIPLLMRCFPRERYGQFCSAWAMFVSFTVMLGSMVSGGLLDLLKKLHGNGAPDFFYRYVMVWTLFFYLLSFAATWLLRREWLRLGGDNYAPPGPGPAPESPC
ncbi:MAG: MFS transporter [Opitutaceae bacterium]|jgi:MFS family permease|nr:MFS transporter [Opitutaceae bacterium]